MAKAKKPKLLPTLAEQLREAIEQAIKRDDLTLHAISRRADVQYASLLRFVKQERDLRLESAGAIANALGLHLTARRG